MCGARFKVRYSLLVRMWRPRTTVRLTGTVAVPPTDGRQLRTTAKRRSPHAIPQFVLSCPNHPIDGPRRSCGGGDTARGRLARCSSPADGDATAQRLSSRQPGRGPSSPPCLVHGGGAKCAVASYTRGGPAMWTGLSCGLYLCEKTQTFSFDVGRLVTAHGTWVTSIVSAPLVRREGKITARVSTHRDRGCLILIREFSFSF